MKPVPIPSPSPSPSSSLMLDTLRVSLGGRAAGWWRVVGDSLELVAFSPADDLPDDVSAAFAGATRSLPLSRVELGIVKAAADGSVVVSLASGLPAEAGSGFWLRRFGAARSVAVPVPGAPGKTEAVVSVALGEAARPDDEVEEVIRSSYKRWTDAPSG